MKVRAFLLIALLIGGAYQMKAQIDGVTEQRFAEWIRSIDAEFDSLLLRSPNSKSTGRIVEDAAVVEEVLSFLYDYHIQETDRTVTDDSHYSITFLHAGQESVTLVAADELLLRNGQVYYRFTDGPDDLKYLIRLIAMHR